MMWTEPEEVGDRKECYLKSSCAAYERDETKDGSYVKNICNTNKYTGCFSFFIGLALLSKELDEPKIETFNKEEIDLDLGFYEDIDEIKSFKDFIHNSFLSYTVFRLGRIALKFIGEQGLGKEYAKFVRVDDPEIYHDFIEKGVDGLQ